MRIYTIDELETSDLEKIHNYLRELDLQAGLEGIYWLPIPRQMLLPLQQEHLDGCGPYCLALELTENALHMELLVRGRGRLHCNCMGFASEELRNHMIRYLEDLLTELHIA